MTPLDATKINSTQDRQTVAFSSPVAVSAGQTIWLAWLFRDNPGIRFISGCRGRVTSSATWSDGMLSPFGTSSVACSIYTSYYVGWEGQSQVRRAFLADPLRRGK